MGTEMLAIGGFWGTIVTWIYMKYKSRHTERMALIESGQDASIFDEKRLSERSNSLKNGMLLLGIGLGWFAGLVIEEIFNLDDALGVIPTLMIGGGIGLILFYRMVQKDDEYLG